VTEFGASSSVPLLANLTAAMDSNQVGWIYWSWKYYGDPTGSASESLVMADGRLRSTAWALSRAYPEAVAGKPIAYSFSPDTGDFSLAYVPDHRVHAPTVIFVPTEIHYPRGYCASVSGGRVTSTPGSDLLDVRSARTGRLVRVSVEPGACAAHSPPLGVEATLRAPRSGRFGDRNRLAPESPPKRVMDQSTVAATGRQPGPKASG
jgi:endoglycosylceramidase